MRPASAEDTWTAFVSRWKIRILKTTFMLPSHKSIKSKMFIFVTISSGNYTDNICYWTSWSALRRADPPARRPTDCLRLRNWSETWCFMYMLPPRGGNRNKNKDAVFWDVAPCRFCVNRRFGGSYRLHLHNRKILERPAHTGSSLEDFSTMKIYEIRSSETSVYTRPRSPKRLHSSWSPPWKLQNLQE
jgi:hypothetical protein